MPLGRITGYSGVIAGKLELRQSELISSSSSKIFAMPTEQEAAALAILKRVSIFSTLSEQEFAFLTSHVLQRKYSSGELIFNEGDRCIGLYVVQFGNSHL